MSIQFKCSNGHEIKVKDKYAGQAGICPTCKVRVTVPVHAAELSGKVSEDAILDFLGPPPVDDMPVHQDPKHQNQFTDPASMSGSSLLGSTILHRGMKNCPKCKREVRAAYDICPHCRTYFTDLTEISRRLHSKCPGCNAETLVTDTRCKACGTILNAHPDARPRK